jgi:hypothetical protein
LALVVSPWAASAWAGCRITKTSYYDYWHQIAGKRRDAQHAAVIAVDDETLLQYKDDPLAFWQPIFAQAMQNLTDAGVKSIGLDFIYAVSAEAWLRKLEPAGQRGVAQLRCAVPWSAGAGQQDPDRATGGDAQGDMELMGPPQEHLLMMPNGAHDTGVANHYPGQRQTGTDLLPGGDSRQGVPGCRLRHAVGAARHGRRQCADRLDIMPAKHFAPA